MKDPAEAIKTKLVAAGVGAALDQGITGWRVGCGILPTAPDTVVICKGMGGLDPFPSLLLNQPSVQVIVRGSKSGYKVARAKATDVVTALLGMSSATLLGDVYRSCIQIGEVFDLGQDDNTRPLFSLNFRFIVEPAAESGETRQPIS